MIIPDRMNQHIKKIFLGEYNVDVNIEQPLIIDIGANIGGFARWAFAKWSNSRIICFEPIKQNYDILVKNTSDIPNLIRYNCAVGSSKRKQKMFYGKNNEGEASLFFGNQQINETEEVEVISAKEIPECHILKIDTEGAEIEIIENLTCTPVLYLIEYHSEKNRIKLDKLLNKKYLLFSSNSNTIDYGIVKYILKTAIKK